MGDLAALWEQEQGRNKGFKWLRGPATASTVLARNTVFGLAKPRFSEPLLLNLTLTGWHLAARCSPPLLVREFAAGVYHLTSHELVHTFLFLP